MERRWMDEQYITSSLDFSFQRKSGCFHQPQVRTPSPVKTHGQKECAVVLCPAAFTSPVVVTVGLSVSHPDSETRCLSLKPQITIMSHCSLKYLKPPQTLLLSHHWFVQSINDTSFLLLPACSNFSISPRLLLPHYQTPATATNNLHCSHEVETALLHCSPHDLQLNYLTA